MLKIIFFAIMLPFIAAASVDTEVESLLNRFSAVQTLEERLAVFSKTFLKSSYSDFGPLGEGPGARFDDSPLYRLDTFDCTTFVETMISLARSNNLKSFKNEMNEIRYENGEVDYFKRNHFTALDWVPHNISNGKLIEINDLIIPQEFILKAKAIVDFPNWLRSAKINRIKLKDATEDERLTRLLELQKSSQNFPTFIEEIHYISINFLLENPGYLANIPEASLVNFIRPNWDLTSSIGTHMNVSHQGLLFWIKGTLYLRHASSAEDKMVTQVPFLDYLKKFKNHPTLKGIHLMHF